MAEPIKLPMEEIIKLHQNNLSLRQIAKVYSVDHMLIYRKLKELKIDTSKKPLEIDKQWIKDLYKDYTITEIAEIFNIHEASLRYLMKKYKIKRIKKTKGTWRVLHMWEQTHNKTYISNIVNVSINTVNKILKENDKLSKGDDNE